VEISLGVQEKIKEKRRKSGGNKILGDRREIRIPGAHDVVRNEGIKRRDIDTIETTVLDNLGVIGQEILATGSRGKFRKTILKVAK